MIYEKICWYVSLYSMAQKDSVLVFIQTFSSSPNRIHRLYDTQTCPHASLTPDYLSASRTERTRTLLVLESKALSPPIFKRNIAIFRFVLLFSSWVSFPICQPSTIGSVHSIYLHTTQPTCSDSSTFHHSCTPIFSLSHTSPLSCSSSLGPSVVDMLCLDRHVVPEIKTKCTCINFSNRHTFFDSNIA